jgi:hypothetical protein
MTDPASWFLQQDFAAAVYILVFGVAMLVGVVFFDWLLTKIGGRR